jgi:Na+-translocating ferredoxin:NAD+ oxidoreductase RnfG subunit
MAKKESTFISMLATLFVVTLVAAGLLGSVYALTKEPIRLAELKKKNEAIQVVVPGYSDALPYHPPTSHILTSRWTRNEVLNSYERGW